MKTKMTHSLALGLAGFALATPSYAAVMDSTNVKFSGYIKLDAMSSTYSDGTIGAGSIGRDFYIPALTPVGGTEESSQFDAHIKQSRFRFTVDSMLENNEKITGVLEFDFQVTPNGDERISNSYSPRVRHAFIKYQNWLFGQTWSTFMDVSALPDSVDFIGTTDGTVFVRQAQIRYSMNGFDIALENPESTITPYGGGGRIVSDDNSTPDLVLRYTSKGDWGHFAIAGLARQLKYVNGGIDDSVGSYGLSLSGKMNVGKDDIRAVVNWGSGLGRYVGLNTANGAVLDANNELEAIDSMGFSIAYRHWWDDKLRSSFIYSTLQVDNPTNLTGMSVTEQTYSVRANLMYSPTKELTFGGEYTFAKRELENSADGDMNRLQLMAKYAF
ncbi:porin [Paraneptunicella aestuarii]|uniref:DcaP family trimeric outer membrane transporter n=1 Tax=Paraneptunicella aestuarii TaxID=2831148 RepID=UPI001E42BF37|nr:DcaP family trimeric outer membrane transporter [Paraneptunicella aestuarii]UAA38504.1 porin [Paraneptunicella aestuarii]